MGDIVLGPKSCIEFNKDKTSWRVADLFMKSRFTHMVGRIAAPVAVFVFHHGEMIDAFWSPNRQRLFSPSIRDQPTFLIISPVLPGVAAFANFWSSIYYQIISSIKGCRNIRSRRPETIHHPWFADVVIHPLLSKGFRDSGSESIIPTRHQNGWHVGSGAS